MPKTILTREEAIAAAIAKYPKARPTPVYNVAGWNDSQQFNRANLANDTRAYAWKADTLKAITMVLKLQGKI